MKVAFDRIKITPEDYVGKPMAGYAREHPCSGKLDDIYANGVLIESDDEESNRILLISLDLLKVPLALTKYIKNAIELEFSLISPKNVIIHCTHTHSAPDLTGEFYWPGGLINVMKGIMFGSNRSDRYIVWFVHQLIKMVQKLSKILKSCKIALIKSEFNPDIVINRRHPTRQTKPELGVISFKSVDKSEIIGFIINYSCHPTTLSFKNDKISADYPGKIIERISQLTNNKINTIYFNGAAGDLNPITTCGTDYDKLDLDKTLIYGQLGTYAHTKHIGYIIAEEALKLVNSIPEEGYFNNLKFQSYLRFFCVPMEDFKYFSKTWFKNKLVYVLKKNLLVRVALITEREANFPKFTLKRKNFKTSVKTVIQFINFNLKSEINSRAFSIMTVPGELFEDYGKLFLNKSPTGRKNSFIFQNSNDWIAYLFPKRDYIEEGGYEPMASFSPICGYHVREEVFKIYDDCKNNELNKD